MYMYSYIFRGVISEISDHETDNWPPKITIFEKKLSHKSRTQYRFVSEHKSNS